MSEKTRENRVESGLDAMDRIAHARRQCELLLRELPAETSPYENDKVRAVIAVLDILPHDLRRILWNEVDDGEQRRSRVYEALTIQALRIAAAQERWGLDGPGIIREFVGELGGYERALAKREEIRIDYLDDLKDDPEEGSDGHL